MAKDNFEYPENPPRVDPTTLPDGDGFEYGKKMAQAIADRVDIAGRPEGTAVVATQYVAKCPHCGFHLQYIFDTAPPTRVIPLNGYRPSQRGRIGLRANEKATYDNNRGVACPRCLQPWRVPAPA